MLSVSHTLTSDDERIPYNLPNRAKIIASNYTIHMSLRDIPGPINLVRIVISMS